MIAHFIFGAIFAPWKGEWRDKMRPDTKSYMAFAFDLYLMIPSNSYLLALFRNLPKSYSLMLQILVILHRNSVDKTQLQFASLIHRIY